MILTGIDILQREGFARLQGRRVGLMTNLSAVDGTLNSTYPIFVEALKSELKAFFAPEHGFSGVVPDGVLLDTSTDTLTGLPIYSLYGESFKPTSDMLQGLDVIVCDIQDIGVRYYTFAWTITYILEAAGEHGVEVMILDRPNPLGGVRVEGAPLDQDQRTIVGRFPIPTRHGLTLGELMQMVNGEWNPTPCDLRIVRCEGWQREMLWSETGLIWVPPSPNMPHFSTLLHYPGSCLIEGTTLSEGRGTPLPFEIVGAPYIDAAALATLLNQQDWAGVRFRPHSFIPTSSKYEGDTCNGIQAHITDAGTFNAVETWLGILTTIHQHYGFEWKPHFNRLIGSAKVHQQIDQGMSSEEITANWQTFCQAFALFREPYLLY